jgi:septal ring factor EnvC (AmiA/AmiB activator)
MIVVVSMVVALFLAFPATGTGQERTQRVQQSIQSPREQSHKVEEQLEQGRSQVENMQRQERKIIEQLDQMELHLQEFRENARRLKAEHESVRREISERRVRLKELTRELDGLQGLLARRLEALYKFGKQAYLEFLISSSDIADLQHRWVYLRDIAEQDQQLLGRLRQQKTEAEELRTSLVQRERKLAGLVADIDQEHQHIEEVRREQVAMLQKVHSQEQTYQQYVQELMGLARELDAKILGLQQEGSGSSGSETLLQPGGFANQKGALRHPVHGDIVARFAAVQHQTFGAMIRRNGIDIAAQPLSPVVAVYSGQVLYSGWIKGYGRVIIIDHGDKYYTVSAQLGDVSKQVGERVEAGEVIGYAGYAPVDSQKGTVYFEIRHEGKPLDPLAWLRAGPTRAMSHGGG